MTREDAMRMLGITHEGFAPTAVQASYTTRTAVVAQRLATAATPDLLEKYKKQAHLLRVARGLLLGGDEPPDGSVAYTLKERRDSPAPFPVAAAPDAPFPIAAAPAAPAPIAAAPAAPAAENLKPGQVLAGRYEIRALLGGGGTGQVFAAFDRVRLEELALKVITPQRIADPAAREGFLNEAKIATNLSHPNIVRVYDVNQTERFTFLTMERLRGRSLRDEAARRAGKAERFSVEEVLRIGRSLCEALAHAHRFTLHRDLKPQNVWLCDDGTVKLLPPNRITSAAAASGTACYTAPEQSRGLEIDHRADQYGVAAILYELLTGDVPQGVIRPPRQLRPDVPSGMSRAVMKALEARPEARHPDMAEMARALAAGPAIRLPKRPAAAAVLLTLLLVAAASVFYLKSGPPRTVTNSIGMKLALIPAGEFLMGSPNADKDARSAEKPQHRVRITRPFYLGATEVTRGQFRRFVDETGYQTQAEKSGDPHSWRNCGHEQTDDHPVVNVTWNDAVAFAGWLSRKEGVTYRLPTEAEWEYACRAGSTTRYSFGDDPEGLAAVGNVADATLREEHPSFTSGMKKEFPGWRTITARDGYSHTAPVGRYRPNTWGLFDMHGNVEEWCWDKYDAYRGPLVDDPRGAGGAANRVNRGGSWAFGPVDARSAFRDGYPPSTRISAQGFRLARDLPGTTGRSAVASASSNRVGDVRQAITNSIGMKLALIPAGEFLMGSPDADAHPFEKPQHRVRITRPFYLGATEVTRGQFARFVDETGYETQEEKNGGEFWRKCRFEQTDDHPVVEVSWNDAVAFAGWLSRKEGVTYRLPTEAEWEYACRAGSTTRYSFGDNPEGLAAVGKVNDGADGARYGFKGTAPVGHYQPNAWGLYDMHGNVEEWCWDGFEAYNGTPVDDPRGAAAADERVLRGGSWYSDPRFALSAFRDGYGPDNADFSLGFRLARDLPGSPGKSAVAAASSNRVGDVRQPTTEPIPGTKSTTGSRAPVENTSPKSITNSIGMKLVLIPAGEFLMGSPDADKDARSAEKPQHRARITSPFYLGATEVTRGQFRRFVDETGYQTQAEKSGDAESWRKCGFEQTDAHPVVNVNWNDAVAFAGWLSRKEGVTYRLPTEAEWEYACRAGSTTLYSFGDGPEGLAAVGNVGDGADGARDGFEYTAPVGRFQPNAWGLFDMHGNVAEWCWDRYKAYRGPPVDDPRGAAAADERVLRGGGWLSDPGGARSAYRPRDEPAYTSSGVGFRLARDLPGTAGKSAVEPASSNRVGDVRQPATGPIPGTKGVAGSRRPVEKTSPKTITNSIGMKLVLIPAGEFLMGSPDADKKAYSDERPQHRVRITSPFYLGATEVTRGQFRGFVDEIGYETQGEKNGDYWRSPGFKQTDAHPVVNVTWNDAAAFARWLSRKEGATYRLPTEAEWEYACRAGSTTRYSFGDDPEKLGTVGNVAEATAKQVVTGLGLALAARDDFAQTAPVGRYHPNAWGLFDMHGNVSEWCSDVYGVDYYKGSPVDDPCCAEGTALQVFRGGGWTANPRGAQSATRYGLAPDKTKSGLLGFRLARGRIALGASKAGQEPATRP